MAVGGEFVFEKEADQKILKTQEVNGSSSVNVEEQKEWEKEKAENDEDKKGTESKETTESMVAKRAGLAAPEIQVIPSTPIIEVPDKEKERDPSSMDLNDIQGGIIDRQLEL